LQVIDTLVCIPKVNTPPPVTYGCMNVHQPIVNERDGRTRNRCVPFDVVPESGLGLTVAYLATVKNPLKPTFPI
jgi:hypothetical protein